MFSRYEQFKEPKETSIRRMIWNLMDHAKRDIENEDDGEYMRGFDSGTQTEAYIAANDLLAILNR